MSKSSDDQRIIDAVRAGETDRFQELVERYWGMVYHLALQKLRNRWDAQDTAQEAFTRAFRYLHTLRTGTRFASWLYSIAMQVCAMEGRRRKRRRGTFSLEEAEVDPPAGGEGADGLSESIEKAERIEAVRAAVGALPDAYRLVVTLRFFEGKSCKEIADHLGEPIGTVTSRLHRAYETIRKNLGECAMEGVDDLS